MSGPKDSQKDLLPFPMYPRDWVRPGDTWDFESAREAHIRACIAHVQAELKKWREAQGSPAGMGSVGELDDDMPAEGSKAAAELRDALRDIMGGLKR
jgi:hypothetical protein